MKVTGGRIQPNALDKNECFVQHDGVCANPKVVKEMQNFLKKEYSLDTPDNSTKVVDTMKKVLGVETEAEILQNSNFRRQIGSREVQQILNSNFKEKGPHNSTALLDNFNIDGTLEKWAKNSKELFGKNFYHIPFQMIDFDKVGSELSTVSIPGLIEKRFDCFGCVLNTDVSTGGGKHWFCIYGDLQHSGSETDPYTIEFFNSSGNPPTREVNFWLEKTCADIMKTLKKHAEIVRL